MIWACLSENIHAIIEVTEGVPHLLLVDMRGDMSSSREAWVVYSSEASSASYVAKATLVGAKVSQEAANFFITIHRPAKPVRLFREEAAALKWLETHRQAA